MYSVKWNDCEFTLSNIWHNIEVIDPTYDLQTMLMVINSYYKFHGNQISPKVLELELREHNLGTGLIAIDWTTNPTYKQVVDEKKGAIIQLKYMYLYLGKKNCLQDINPDHLAKYCVIVSCRPREFVIEETLDYRASMEDNLEKLEEAGDLVIFDNQEAKIALSSAELESTINDMENTAPIEQNNLTNAIQDGTKMAIVNHFDFKELFQMALEHGPEIVTTDGPDECKITILYSDGDPFPIVRTITIDGEEKYGICEL